ncbi:hypothetical protein CPAR01_06808 [Colletotrichum paranaense]|uniref:Uncharacterized protein n=1 Tax=Colletotrichum paranaense TaxID=1914294 RepID=A0ABQ9SNJ7_9PEZI|nr:uncharacterized protein CPAR01_06808 [Colletotrichum paranaense]KAK1540819.1 hypothetical protein CPAR01_06808 [Colletotrichum paranaense]
MLQFIIAFAAVAAGARVYRRQEDCSSTTTLDALTVTRVEPISIYILPQQLAPTGTNNDPFTAVYTTVYPTFCPECSQGLRPETYTITQTCTGITGCQPSGSVLPPGFTTTQATCTDCPTPFSAVLTVPQATDAVVTSTFLETITEPGLTTTRTIVQTCASEPCLPQITNIPGRVSTFDGGLFAEPVTQTATVSVSVTVTDKSTATVTADADPSFRPGNFNSGAGHVVSSDKSLVLCVSAFVLLLIMSS